MGGEHMGDSDKLLVFGAAYADSGDAMADYYEIRELYGNGEIGVYDAAVMTREASGEVVVANADSAGRGKVAGKGAVVGAVLGVVFPPSVLGLAALGAATGAAAGRVSRHLKRADLKDIGELLQPGESGVILVTESVSDWAAKKLLSRSMRQKRGEVEGDAEAIAAAIKQAAD